MMCSPAIIEGDLQNNTDHSGENVVTTPSTSTQDHNISQESSIFNQSAENWRQESTQNAPTIASSDFKTPGSTSNVFCPNPPQTKILKTGTPDEILTENSLTDFKTYGLSKEEINRIILLSPVRDKFKGWKPIDEIGIGFEEGCYLIENNGFLDPLCKVLMKHCTALCVTKDHYEYFDSLGTPLQKDLDIPVISNAIQFQDSGYNTCSLHAVNFLQERDRLGSMKKVQESYPSAMEEFLYLNDEYVYENTKPKVPDKQI